MSYKSVVPDRGQPRTNTGAFILFPMDMSLPLLLLAPSSREYSSFLAKKSPMVIAGSVPGIDFQAGIRAFESHSRPITIGNAKIQQKPLFPRLGVSIDLFKLRIGIGGSGNGNA